jgi:hypothetical protein
MNQQIHFNVASLTAAFMQIRTMLTILVVVGLFGYTGYQISRISGVQPSQGYVALQESQKKVPNLHVNASEIKQIEQLQSPGSTTIQVTTGKQDPFSFN